MKRSLIAVGAAAAVVAVMVPVAVWASSGSGHSVLSCQSFTFSTTPASTSTTAWANIPGMTFDATLAEAYQVQMSANFAGAPVIVRVQETESGGTFTMQPGGAVARPVGGQPTSFAYTWVASSPAEHAHTFQAQWRLWSGGGTATITRGDLTLLFEGAPTPSDC
ncbi:MAG TPA: hypothetical protein DIU14_09070 [Actinobacteria bacterium]|nr:hypothetical protein [Actinomycetota bacterium]